MSKFGTFLKVGALCSTLAVSIQSFAASFQVPINFSVELVDGKSSDFGYNRFDRTLDLSAGRHQIVLLFEGSFGSLRDSRLVQAGNPIVVEIANMPQDANYTFTYDVPRDEREAQAFSRSQKINLIDAKTKSPLPEADASYYILTSDSGFSILRNYRDDLASVGRLYAPNPLEDKKSTKEVSPVGVNASGVTTVQARSGAVNAGAAAGTTVASAAVSSTAAAAVASNAADAAKPAKTVQSLSNPNAAATFNNLVELYNKADDQTKLQFVKYILAN